MRYTFENETDSPELVSEPKFDDERTVISARPVVPLEKIEAKARHRRQWFLGGAFAIAMMLGAASALVTSYIRLRHAQTPPVAAARQTLPPTDTPVAAPVVVAENPPVTPVADVENEEATAAEDTTTPADEESIPVESTPKKQTPVKRRPEAAVRHDEYVVPEDNRNVTEEDDLYRIRDSVLYDEWQERRARRVRRERRRAERYNHRDLSNLDEIFEGRRRSNP